MSGGMNPGLDTDIVTGRPTADVAAEKERAKARREEDALQEQAAFLPVMESEPARKLAALVVEHLERRVAVLVEADPQAAAYLQILKELGYREAVAKKAVEALIRRYTAGSGPP